MLKQGTLIRVQTKTKEDVFGDCLFEIVETDISMSNPSGGDATITDGVKCVMLGGSGPSARKGFVVMDRASVIEANIRTGITEIVSDEKRKGIVDYYEDKAKDGTPRRVTGSTGVVEME